MTTKPRVLSSRLDFSGDDLAAATLLALVIGATVALIALVGAEAFAPSQILDQVIDTGQVLTGLVTGTATP